MNDTEVNEMAVMLVNTTKILEMFDIPSESLGVDTKVAYSANRVLVFSDAGVVSLPFSKKDLKKAIKLTDDWYGYRDSIEAAIYVVAFGGFSIPALSKVKNGVVLYGKVYTLLKSDTVVITGATLINRAKKLIKKIEELPTWKNKEGVDFLKFGDIDAMQPTAYKESVVGVADGKPLLEVEADKFKKYVGKPDIPLKVEPLAVDLKVDMAVDGDTTDNWETKVGNAIKSGGIEGTDLIEKKFNKAMGKVKLSVCQQLYQKVGSTDAGSVYQAVALRDDLKIAARFKGGHVSVRAEGDIKKYTASLTAAGYTVHGSGSHASFHVQAGTKSLRHKVLGAGIFGLCLEFPKVANDFESIGGE